MSYSYQNLKEKCSTLKSQIVINLASTKYSVVQNASKQLNLMIQNSKQTHKNTFSWDIKWTDISLGNDIVQKLNKHQKINYFIGISSIARKNLLMVNLYTMKKYFPEEYDFFPQTFQYPKQKTKIKNFYNSKTKNNQKVTFIVKPQASCQGRGIYLTQSLTDIQKEQKSIVQQYIAKPMLYEGLKFDFRVYVLLKSVSPLEIYIYKQGLVRFATEKYEQPSSFNIDNLCLHLTNYAINKLNPKYQFNKTFSNLQFGHKKSLAEFFKSLKQINPKFILCWKQIKQCIIKTFISVQPHLQYEYRKAQPKNQNQSICFQILGFDFMIDENMKVFLLEVNQSPSFSTETPLDFLVKNYLIKDTLKIIMHQKQTKREDIQMRVKNFKNLVKKQSEEGNFLKQILGNYQKIFPLRDNFSQKIYDKMLFQIKNDYYGTSNVNNNCRKVFLSQKISETANKSPQLKLRYSSMQSFPQPSQIELMRNVSKYDYSKRKPKAVSSKNNLNFSFNQKNLFPQIKCDSQKRYLSKNQSLGRQYHTLERQKQIKAIQNLDNLQLNQIRLKKSNLRSQIFDEEKSTQINQALISNQKINSDKNLEFDRNEISQRKKIVFSKPPIFQASYKKYSKYVNPLEKVFRQRTQISENLFDQSQQC